jgi:hypothetical protein
MQPFLYVAFGLAFVLPQSGNSPKKFEKKEAAITCDCYRQAIKEYEIVMKKVEPFLAKRKKKDNGKFSEIDVVYRYDFGACIDFKRPAELKAYRSNLRGAGLTAFEKATNVRVQKKCGKYIAKIKSYKLGGF